MEKEFQFGSRLKKLKKLFSYKIKKQNHPLSVVQTASQKHLDMFRKRKEKSKKTALKTMKTKEKTLARKKKSKRKNKEKS